MNPRINVRGMSIAHRADWPGLTVKYRVASGEWKQKRVPMAIRTEAAAFRYVEGWLEGQREAAEASESKRHTIADLHDKWMAFRTANPDLQGGTLKRDRSDMRTHILPAIGNLLLTPETARPAVLAAFVRSLRQPGRATYTIRNIVNTLTQFFHDALRMEWIDLPANPMAHPNVREEVPVGSTKAGRRTIIHVRLRDLAALVTSPKVPEFWRVLDMCAAMTGLDVGELAGLKVGDVDLDATPPRWEVRRGLQAVGRDGRPRLGPLKTESRERTTPLHRAVAAVMREWMGAPLTERLGHAPKADDPVFPSEKGAHFRPRVADSLRRDLKAAGLADTYSGHPITFKGLRRSFATYLEDLDVSETRRARLMGHALKTVTSKHYTHSEITTLAAEVEKIVFDPPVGAIVKARKGGRRQ